MRYVYLDESIFSKPNPRFGYGALITEKEVEQSIISQAMESLINDPDRFEIVTKIMDDKTIARGSFHASEDSKNSHSHICSRINQELDASFNCDFFDISKMEPNERNDKFVYHLCAKLSSLEALNTLEAVKFVFEHRNGLCKSELFKWYKNMEYEILLSIYNRPFIPAYFPSIDFHIDNKNNPGLQIADFLLWAVNRYANGDSKWFDRLNLSMQMQLKSDNDQLGGIMMTFKRGIIHPICYYDPKDIPANSESFITYDMICQFYINAERIIDYLQKNGIPDNIRHIEKDIDYLHSNKYNKLQLNYITLLATVYLKIFDMIPIIDSSTTIANKQTLLLAKKYFSLLLRTDMVDAVRTCQYLMKVRANVIDRNQNLINI